MISKKFIHNLLFIILFLGLDAILIAFDVKSMLEPSNNDIFGGIAFEMIMSFVLYMPFFISQMLYLLGSNILFKTKLCGIPK